MAKLPTVAIIGRPNTGKSTLFNKMAGKRIAIESEVPGTTRDHIVSMVEGDEADYLLVDTGGMGGGTDDKDFEDDVHAQSLIALDHADVILFTVNSREELTKSDQDVIDVLRKRRKRHVPVLLIVTKCDTPDRMEEAVLQYQGLGITQEVLATSGSHNMGIAEVEETVERELRKLHFGKRVHAEAEEGTVPRIAIVGKPNAGKSSIVNALMSDTQREESPRLVSPVPGTTRDTTDTTIRHDNKPYVFIDTAGLRRHGKIDEGIESLSMLRAVRAVEEADICLLVIDATQPVSRQDKRVASIAVEAGKGIIILLNKSDLLTSEQKKEKVLEVKSALLFCRYAPLLSTSAKTRDGLLKMFPLIDTVQRNRLRRIPAKELHRWLSDRIYGQPMGAIATTKHITQAEWPPPTFVLFVKNPKQVQLSQLRYLDNRIRETFDFIGTPIRWITKGPRDRR